MSFTIEDEDKNNIKINHNFYNNQNNYNNYDNNKYIKYELNNYTSAGNNFNAMNSNEFSVDSNIRKGGDKQGIADRQEQIGEDYNLAREERIRRKKKKNQILYFSIKYSIFVATLWLIFLAAFIVGFIVHFDVKGPVTASGIIWSFSALVFFLAVVYSYIYYKAKRNISSEYLQRYLRMFPV